jgi:hypothetical protein
MKHPASVLPRSKINLLERFIGVGLNVFDVLLVVKGRRCKKTRRFVGSAELATRLNRILVLFVQKVKF